VQDLLRAAEITKSFRMGTQTIEVLKGITCTFARGESVSIVGASGTGKSTLLHILGTIDEASSGQVFFEDQELTHASDATLALFRSRRLGFVFQFHHLLPEFSALENVAMPLLLQGQAQRERLDKAQQALTDVGLAGKGQNRPGELSGGEQQRVAVARALVSNPDLILADEPTGNLDRQTGEQLMDLLFQLNEAREQTLIYVTHNEDLAHRAQRQLILQDGKLN